VKHDAIRKRIAALEARLNLKRSVLRIEGGLPSDLAPGEPKPPGGDLKWQAQAFGKRTIAEERKRPLDEAKRAEERKLRDALLARERELRAAEAHDRKVREAVARVEELRQALIEAEAPPAASDPAKRA
jgi:hypothetical protein